MKKRVFAMLLCVAMILNLVACGSSSSEQADSSTEEVATGESTFVTVVSSIPETFYFSYFNDEKTTLTRGIWDPMLYVSGGKTEYYLVDDMQFSEDGLVYTFHLNEDATWSDGEAITTDDVLFTLDVYSVWEDYYSSSFRFVDEKEVVYEAVDEHTFTATLPSVNAGFLREFSTYFKLMPSHVFDNPKDAVDSEKFTGTDVVTSGAYTVSEVTEDSVVLTKRDDYYRGTPGVDTLVYRLLGEGVSSQVAFENGDISYTRVTTSADLDKYSSDDNYAITVIPEDRLNYLQFNHVNFESRLTDDARKAIILALNVDEIVAAAYGSTELATPATSVLCPNFSVYEGYEGYSQDIETAKSLAKASGLVDLTLNYVYCNERANMEEVATVIQAQLAEIGVKVEVQGYDYSTFSDIEYGGEDNWDMMTNGLDSMRGDGLPNVGFMTEEWGTCGWSEKTIELAQSINKTPGLEEQKAIAKELHESAINDYVCFPISWPNYVIVSRSNVSGLDASAIVPEFADPSAITIK